MFTQRSVFLSLALLLSLSGCFKSEKNKDEKVLHIPVITKIKGFDPLYSNDLYAAIEIARVYEGLLSYHYLKRPYTLEANLASEMPQVSADQRIYTFKIRKGVLFHDNACFKGGVGRELQAKDFIYSFLRNANPQMPSEGWWLVDNKIKGLNEWREQILKTGQVNYDQEVEGLKALDPYTLQITLNKPSPQFLYTLAMPPYFAIPRECVDFYGQEFLNHPVGTGPFILPEFKQSNRIVYTKNPKFRDKFYPTEASEEFKAQGLLNDAGKKLPMVDKIIVDIVEESQPRWLKFIKGDVDFVAVPKDNYKTTITPDHQLVPEMIKKKVQLNIYPNLEVTYYGMNHANPLFQNKKLRQALSLALDGVDYNQLFQNNLAILAQSIVPPGLDGYDPNYKSPYRQYDLKKAVQLLKEAGYEGGKGLPNITIDMPSSSEYRQIGEWIKKSLEPIGVHITPVLNPWPEFQNKLAKKQVMMYGMAWNADYPDAEDFFAILYGPNEAPGTNHANYKDPHFDEMYRKYTVMPPSEERTKGYKEMNRYLAEEVPMIFDLHRSFAYVYQSWLKNFTGGELIIDKSLYWNVDMKEKEKVLRESF